MLALRSATLGDAPLLRRWERAPHLAQSLGDDDWRWETALADVAPWRDPLIAELYGRPIGFLEIIDPAGDEECYWGEMPSGNRAIDIWIGEADALGQGHGSAMLRLALEKCFADPGVHTAFVDPLASNHRAHRFYERHGFAFAQRRRFGDDDTFVYQLIRKDFFSKSAGSLSGAVNAIRLKL